MELSCIAARQAALLSILRRELRLSASEISRIKTRQAFFVNGQSVYTDHPVVPGDRVLVRLWEQVPDFPAENGPISILYEDDGLIALDKPPGLLLHPSAHRNAGTLANRLLGHYARTGQACGVHPVSRLDRDTFGVVLFAKNAHLHALCARGFEKRYLACVYGGPESQTGEITLPIARKNGSLWREIRADGQAAQTRWQVQSRAGGLCGLELEPVTGRTHQLRLHCMAAGFPILGDPVYQTVASAARSAELGLATQQLLAKSLRFSHPLTGAAIEITSKQTVFQP